LWRRRLVPSPLPVTGGLPFNDWQLLPSEHLFGQVEPPALAYSSLVPSSKTPS